MTPLLDIAVMLAAVCLLFVWLDWPERDKR
jgi:hypothetical protein